MLSKKELLGLIDERYPLEKKDIGTMSKAKVSGMNFEIEQYRAKGLGNVSFMRASGMLGLMKMDTMMINPFEIDMPLLSYDYISAFGKITLLNEMYKTCIDEGPQYSKLNEVQEKYIDLESYSPESRWYDEFLLPVSVFKKGKKNQTPVFDGLTKEYVEAYLLECASAKPCDVEEKKKASQYYTEGLLNNGGPSTDLFVKKMGLDYTKKLFRDILFATGTPEGE